MAEDRPVCASCGAWDGMVDGDAVRRLKPVRIMGVRETPKGAPEGYGRVLLCQDCTGRMPFDLGAFIDEVDVCSVGGAAWDTTFYHFLVQFVTVVWGAYAPPTYQDLCNVCNAANITTQTGGRWDYHNMRQKCMRLGVDPKALYATRAPVGPPPESAEMLAQAVGAVSAHPQMGDHLLQPEWRSGALPVDMPGQ